MFLSDLSSGTVSDKGRRGFSVMALHVHCKMFCTTEPSIDKDRETAVSSETLLDDLLVVTWVMCYSLI